MKHYASRATAEEAASAYNRATVEHRRPLMVVVDGPLENGASTMPLREAIENDFTYSWSAR